MKGNRAALRYAKAILSLAQDKNLTKEVNGDMVLINETMDKSSDLRNFLKSPVTKNSIKKSALLEIFKNVNPMTAQLLEVLLQNNRIDILWLVTSNFMDLFNELNGVQKAVVTTAVPLSPAMEMKVQRKVKELTGNEAEIKNFIDPGIIGGFILRVGDIQYNGSVDAQLKTLKREFKNNTYVSKLN